MAAPLPASSPAHLAVAAAPYADFGAVASRPRRSTASLLSFFGVGISVHGDVPDLAFQFGPHIARTGRVDLSVDVTESEQPDVHQICVRRSDGLALWQRQLRGWTNVPPPIPPFAAMSDRLCLLPAVVLAKGRATVALLGSSLPDTAQIAMSLAYRSWRFVSPQFLVLDRRTGETLPFLVPLELRGAGAELVRSGAHAGALRVVRSPLDEDVVQLRPESIGGVVRVEHRLAPPTLIGLCRTSRSEINLAPADFPVQGWPNRHRAAFAALPRLRLELPPGALADHAAARIDRRFGDTRAGTAGVGGR